MKNVTVHKKDYSWGRMVTIHQGSDQSFPLHPEHQEVIKNLKDGDKKHFKIETGSRVNVSRQGDTISLKQPGASAVEVSHHHFVEEAVAPKMKKFSQFVAEATKVTAGKTFKDVHHDLLKAGMTRAYSQGYRSPNGDSYERSYSANHTPEQVHKILVKHGFNPVTHYRQGGKMPLPYSAYRDDRAGGSSFSLHHKDGKVHYMTWNGRQSHD